MIGHIQKVKPVYIGFLVQLYGKISVTKPFTSVIESFGEPFYVPKNLPSKEVPLFCEKLEKKLKELQSSLKDIPHNKKT